ncbi:unnamed protein product [Plutella xylostella]|uniref:(diamondback moth) hypothetical protein n=1 Tax=Plutella xylostella TaxID=51655 RepID=A0A8S4F7I3_PLUXY|nr:unnamed protein product [Plutella xylostella]
MNHVGKRYMTSKTVDLTTLKASPQSYGFQGQSLASLVEVSRVVNITSKTDQSEDTWEKSFQKGKEKDVLPSATRPSKGTTVDIKGFLYNLKIQKQAVNSLREIQNIKSFLECISLVHNNISISLRDNSKNEIIFQVNKCRNIYQTLATIFSLEKDKILEFRVEKKCYGVTAYMGKVVSEENENHWIYLNGRFMPQCNLHHILDSNIVKLFDLKKQIKTKKLLKTAYPEDEDVFKKHIPFYYVFITCPYDDYDFNTTSKQNTVEFKNWNEVTKLLEKLVQFYGGNNLYNEFNEAVETNTEIFEPNIDYVNNTTTKDIVKVNQKLSKDNASLNFDAVNLRAAELQGQVDDKFIAATIKGKTGQTGGLKKYLVLFDQHAVHERIRLESNLAEYMSNNEWKSVDLDEISIKLKPDEIHYLHNYKAKFAQLGLKWNTVDENEISITGIPQAIIGNNTRQVDIIMKSAKNLILEEIEAIKSQKGSICLYPKSIMNLVFSEACRYAIKFGDKLSHAECTKLLRDLSECKTPFQCAHGRPVMAVITELKNRKAEYKINFTKVADFKRNLGKL